MIPHGKPACHLLLCLLVLSKLPQARHRHVPFSSMQKAVMLLLSQDYRSLHQGTSPAPPHPQLPTLGCWWVRLLILLTIFPRHRWWCFFHLTRYFWRRCCRWCCTALRCWALSIRDSRVNSFQWRNRVCKWTVRRR